RYVRSRFLEQHAGARTGTDALVGSRALVLARLAPHQAGRVRVNGEEWRAMLAPGQAAPIEEGAEVVVSGVDGVTLLVR
ncbi:MAG TPA: NfeD family protein, partial [Candidatus Polarisedimenticolia bacterium]|nr:NfeD family protein [Candidatus Polarisedimenticolia bacterium]